VSRSIFDQRGKLFVFDQWLFDGFQSACPNGHASCSSCDRMQLLQCQQSGCTGIGLHLSHRLDLMILKNYVADGGFSDAGWANDEHEPA
jgi:hypothetical protein